MNSKVKGVLQVLLVLVLIAAFAFVAARGIGGAHRGSAKNIRLGLDLEGGVSVTYQAYKTDSTVREPVNSQPIKTWQTRFTRCRNVWKQ